MNETSLSAKKTFSRLGIVYTVMSVVVTVLQFAVSWIGSKTLSSEIFNANVQVIISSGILYVAGMLILCLGLKAPEMQKLALTKHKMSVGDLLKAFCMCYAVLIASNILGLMLTSVIGTIKGSQVVNPVEVLTSELSLPVLLVFTVVCAPIFEELFFRKFIIDRVVVYGELTAILLSGFMFGLFHGNLSQFPYAFAIGIFFGFIYIRTGNIVYPMILHAMINFFGSVASAFVMSGAGNDVLNDMMNAGAEADIFGAISMESLMGLVGLLVFELIIMIIVIIGIILWILNGKKITLYTRRQDLPRGSRFSTALGNPGMIAYIIVWIAMIIYSLF